MKTDVDKGDLIAGAYLALVVVLMVGGISLFLRSEQNGPAVEAALSAVDKDLIQTAEELNADVPIKSGSGLIMGASYDAGANVFTFDLRSNPELFTEIPEELFFIASEDALNCAKQTRLLIEMNKDTAVAYRLFDKEGRLKNRILLEKGACSVLPVITPKPVNPTGGS